MWTSALHNLLLVRKQKFASTRKAHITATVFQDMWSRAAIACRVSWSFGGTYLLTSISVTSCCCLIDVILLQFYSSSISNSDYNSQVILRRIRVFLTSINPSSVLVLPLGNRTCNKVGRPRKGFLSLPQPMLWALSSMRPGCWRAKWLISHRLRTQAYIYTAPHKLPSLWLMAKQNFVVRSHK